MRRLSILSSLLLLLATSSWQKLLAHDLAANAPEPALELAEQQDRTILRMLLAMGGNASAPFTQPIGNGFIDGGLITGPLAMSALGKVSGAVKGGAIAAAVAAVWAYVVKTLGGANETKRKSLHGYAKDAIDRLKRDMRVEIKASRSAEKQLPKDVKAQTDAIEKFQKSQAKEDNKLRQAVRKQTLDLEQTRDKVKPDMLRRWGKLGEDILVLQANNAALARENVAITNENEARRKKPKPYKDIPYAFDADCAAHAQAALGDALKEFFNIAEN